MGEADFSTCLERALTKGFAARNPRVRAAYMDLAEFYDTQLRKSGHYSDPQWLFFR